MKKNGGKFLKIFFTHEKMEANLGPQKIKKSKVLKIKIRSAQIVGEVFFMPEKGVPAPFGALPAHFFRGPEKSKNYPNFAYFPWWAHGPYSPGLGPLLLSTRGGAIGIDWQGLLVRINLLTLFKPCSRL